MCRPFQSGLCYGESDIWDKEEHMTSIEFISLNTGKKQRKNLAVDLLYQPLGWHLASCSTLPRTTQRCCSFLVAGFPQQVCLKLDVLCSLTPSVSKTKSGSFPRFFPWQEKTACRDQLSKAISCGGPSGCYLSPQPSWNPFLCCVFEDL